MALRGTAGLCAVGGSTDGVGGVLNVSTFIIAEEEFWQPGLDFAGALRLRGHTAVRLTANPANEPRRGGLRRWATVPTVTIDGAINDDGLPNSSALQEIEDVRPVDWQASESILNWLSRHGYEQQLRFERSSGLPTHEVQDKSALTRFLSEHGLAVPATWDDIDAIPPGQAGPFMFKLRDRGGGEGIHRCQDVSQLRACEQLFSPLPYIVQVFHTRTPVIAAGVARAGTPVQIMTYTSILNPATPFTMAYGLRVVDDPLVRTYAEQVISALGVTGPFALDTVADDSGRPLALDMNLRIWGSWTACQAVGMDVVGAYEYALGLGPHPGAVRFTADTALILRRPPLDVATMPQRARWLAAEAAEIRRRSAWLGRRWARCSLRDAVGWAARGAALE